jgi:hypothetical protein
MQLTISTTTSHERQTTMSHNTNKFLTLTDAGLEMVLAEGSDVDKVLAGSLRAEPQYGPDASHRTVKGTRKFQCNAPVAFEVCMAKIMRANDFEKEGQAIRLVLAEGLKALGFDVEIDEEV